MRSARASLFVMISLGMASAATAESFPYKAYVRGNDVYVRSGPGKNYYPTDKLGRGAEIEVYRHDPGGWFAVRPPEDNFSWVAGRHLNPLEDNLAEVTGDEVVAYVGSKFSDVHDVRQVKLDRGELVEVIGEKRFVSPNDGLAETWFKVSPPRGEFRWIHGRYVVRQGIAATTAEHVKPEKPGGTSVNRWTDAKSHARSGDAPTDEPGNRFLVETSSSEPLPTSTVDAGNSGGQQIRIAPESFGSSNSEIRLAAATSPVGSRHAGTTSYDHGGRKSNGRLTSLDEVNHDLSLMLADPPSSWSFVDLRSQAQIELDRADSALARGKARMLLREIDRYERLQQEYQDVESLRAEVDRANQRAEIAATPTTLATPAVTTAPASSVQPPDLSEYDGVGRLTPVVSKRVGAPRFALTTASGEVLMFVTPATGIDMQAYVGQVVGLTGTRGFMPELRKSHLTAVRVQQLQSTALLAVKPSQN